MSESREVPAAADELTIDQPGLGVLRDAIARSHLWLPTRKTVRDDAVAGAGVIVANVPDGMANGLLVGVNPIHGLYATMVGPLVGGALSSTELMVISTTAAASLTAGQSLASVPADTRTSALFALVVLVGVFQVAFGMLGLSRLAGFVSYSVLTGFLAGVSALLILSQLPTVTGYAAIGSNKVSQAVNLAANLDAIDPASLGTTILTIALAVLLPRTRVGSLGRLFAIAIPAAVVALTGLSTVRLVSDVGAIEASLPQPEVPGLLRLAPLVITGAMSVALVVLVQGVGVSQTVPRSDGRRTDVRRDIIAQGAANIASGIFKGLPIGGSLSTTALNVMGGARSRWSSIFAGAGMAVIVVLVPGLVSLVPMPSLGALLILAGLGSLKPRELQAVLSTGWPSLLAAGTTFVATLFLPIQAAVGLGVVLSALLYVSASSTDVLLVELVELPGGQVEERAPARRLYSDRITTFDVYGHLFYAGARTLDRLLPSAHGTQRPAVILSLRGRSTLGATLIDVLARYADAIGAAGGRLYLSGISANAYSQIVRTGKLKMDGAVRVFQATPIVGQSTREARAHAEAWLAGADS